MLVYTLNSYTAVSILRQNLQLPSLHTHHLCIFQLQDLATTLCEASLKPFCPPHLACALFSVVRSHTCAPHVQATSAPFDPRTSIHHSHSAHRPRKCNFITSSLYVLMFFIVYSRILQNVWESDEYHICFGLVKVRGPLFFFHVMFRPTFHSMRRHQHLFTGSFFVGSQYNGGRWME